MKLKITHNQLIIQPKCAFLSTSRDHLRPSVAYTILLDEDMEIGGFSDFNYFWHAVVSGRGEGVQVAGGAGVRGAALVGSRGEAPAGGSEGSTPRLPRNELKMFHEQILSRNEA